MSERDGRSKPSDPILAGPVLADYEKLLAVLDQHLADEMTDPVEVARAILTAGFHTKENSNGS